LVVALDVVFARAEALAFCRTLLPLDFFFAMAPPTLEAGSRIRLSM
jgi:hypothetical protein